MNRFSFHTDFESAATLEIRHISQQAEMLVSEAVLRVGGSHLPDGELARRGVIQISRDNSFSAGPISTFMWDGKPIVQWRLENWKLTWEWLPDAPPLIEIS